MAHDQRLDGGPLVVAQPRLIPGERPEHLFCLIAHCRHPSTLPAPAPGPAAIRIRGALCDRPDTARIEPIHSDQSGSARLAPRDDPDQSPFLRRSSTVDMV
ncbi:hypothetical protein Raf01_06750 [Rugosimonospora africana]|uniref:Uncharacterized protein n=1 Tax=Rugosimonospora africana TaxID=556532 RepID=A0A8J3QMW8_9ACTN|nr:hypothetical protein Raf01_06750 [Rugosimonospora africana]